MIWIAIGVFLAGYLTIRLLTAGLCNVASSKLKGVLADIQRDKDWLESQSKLVDKRIVDTETKVMNQLNAIKVLAQRLGDPKWMEKFSEGRENAPWN